MINLFWVAFVAALLGACVTDVRSRRIPNWLVLLLLVAGLVHSAVARPFPRGTLIALGAFALGFAIWIPFYALRMLGAGDVKLFAAASAWLAPGLVVDAALASALIGGALALFWFFRSQGAMLAVTRLIHATQRPGVLREPLPVVSTRQRVPYGVAMTAGLLFTVWRAHLWI